VPRSRAVTEPPWNREADLIEAQFTARDGRRVAYASFGDPDGFPVIHCHGSAESRLFEADPDWTAQRGVRVITPDRPGFGGSDSLRDRRFWGGSPTWRTLLRSWESTASHSLDGPVEVRTLWHVRTGSRHARHSSAVGSQMPSRKLVSMRFRRPANSPSTRTGTTSSRSSRRLR
jgi:pimeloyl-ACP methyl ester carboxylesterase